MSKHSGSLRNRCKVKLNAKNRGKLKRFNKRSKKQFGPNKTAIELAFNNAGVFTEEYGGSSGLR